MIELEGRSDMPMDRDHRLEGDTVDHRSEAREHSDSKSSFGYARRDEAVSVAEEMMERYADVLRELAK